MEYQFESLGPALRWIVLAFLLIFLLVAVAAAAGVAALPGWIAKRRRHPNAAAINVCGWFGLPTGVLWVVAIVWAYLESEPYVGSKLGASNASQSEIDRMEQQVAALQVVVERLEEGSR